MVICYITRSSSVYTAHNILYYYNSRCTAPRRLHYQAVWNLFRVSGKFLIHYTHAARVQYVLYYERAVKLNACFIFFISRANSKKREQSDSLVVDVGSGCARSLEIVPLQNAIGSTIHHVTYNIVHASTPINRILRFFSPTEVL